MRAGKHLYGIRDSELRLQRNQELVLVNAVAPCLVPDIHSDVITPVRKLRETRQRV
jgi:hypothetical protein